MVKPSPPAALIEYDAHKAAATYRAFASSVAERRAPIQAKIIASRAEFFAQRGRAPTVPNDMATAGRMVDGLCARCIARAEFLESGHGGVWLAEAEAVRIMRMHDGQALSYLLQTGDTWRVFGNDWWRA